MKAILIVMVYVSGLWLVHKDTKQQPVSAKDTSVRHIDSNYFKARIEPILQKNCSPCHFPGGKQYEKLPFDKAETIINHGAVALKRLKDDKEKALVREFINQEKTDKN